MAPEQVRLLERLAGGPAIQELCQAVLTEPDVTKEECEQWQQRLAQADPIPAICIGYEDRQFRPKVNPAQLLGVAFDDDSAKVSSG